MDRPITTEEFQRTIRQAIQQHSTNYRESYALSIRWERDDTSAYQDVGYFQSLLSPLRLAAAREIILKAGDVTPGWTVQEEFTKALNAARDRRFVHSRLLLFFYCMSCPSAQTTHRRGDRCHRRKSARSFLVSSEHHYSKIGRGSQASRT